jgi:hypothetical protein
MAMDRTAESPAGERSNWPSAIPPFITGAGAECIISGIRPAIAQTIVHLGVDLGGVTTKASLADALRLAFQKTGRSVVRGGTNGSTNGGARTPGTTASRMD